MKPQYKIWDVAGEGLLMGSLEEYAILNEFGQVKSIRKTTKKDITAYLIVDYERRGNDLIPIETRPISEERYKKLKSEYVPEVAETQ